MPTGNRGTIRTRMRRILGSFPIFQGDYSLSSSQLDEAIVQALKRYSRDQPQVIIEDETGDSGRYYPLSNLASWDNDFSEILAIDWDAGTRVSSDEMPQFLSEDDHDWEYYRDASTRYFFFPNRAPTSSTTFRVTYTGLHDLTDATSTVPAQYEEAIVYLAVSRLALMAMIRLEKQLDPPQGENFSIRNKGSGFKTVMDMYEELYIQELGGKEVPAASAIKEYDQEFTTKDQYIFHGRSVR